MTAQWVGGGRLIESLTGLSYQTSLLIFVISVSVYVIIGGFRAVVLTDTVQGVIMLVGTVDFVNCYDCCRWRIGKYYVQVLQQKIQI